MSLIKKYTDPAFPGSFSGLERFYKSIKEKNLKIKKPNVVEELTKEDAYTLHFPSRKKFQRNQIIVNGIDDTWQADLVDVRNLSAENEGNKYILTVIDVFSKYAWAVPLKVKTGKELVRAFSEILDNRHPKRLQVDDGTEFKNKEFRALMKEHGIHMYSTKSEVKASIVERFNRTLKEKMWRMFTFRDNKNYIDDLQKLIKSYNNSYHRSIKTKPILVKKANENRIWFNLYGYEKKEGPEKTINIRFKVGDKVRISRIKPIFSKGYTQNWSDEIFEIVKIYPKIPPVYKIKDSNNEKIEGQFYQQELQKVIPVEQPEDLQQEDLEEGEYRMQILKTRKRKGKEEVLVKWIDYPDHPTQWIPATDITR